MEDTCMKIEKILRGMGITAEVHGVSTNFKEFGSIHRLSVPASEEETEAIRAVNGCIDLQKMKSLPNDQVNAFIKLIEYGSLVFSGDLTGFHITIGPNTVQDCANKETTTHPEFLETS